MTADGSGCGAGGEVQQGLQQVGVGDDARHLVLAAQPAAAGHPSGEGTRGHEPDPWRAHADIAAAVGGVVRVAGCEFGVELASESFGARCGAFDLDDEQMARPLVRLVRWERGGDVIDDLGRGGLGGGRDAGIEFLRDQMLAVMSRRGGERSISVTVSPMT